LQSFRKNSPVPVAVAEGMAFSELLVVMLWPQWLHVRFSSPAVPSLQTSRRDVGRTSSLESDLPQSITPGTDSDADPLELGEPPEPADGLPPDELGELAAEEGAELGVAEALELVGWHAVMRADPRTAQMASDIWEFRIMQPTTAQPLKRL
jgi:hypothetical protein